MTQAIWVILGVLAAPVVLLLATTGCGLSTLGAPPRPDWEPPLTYEQTVLNTAGLLGYWRLGETSGAIAFNSFMPGTLDGDYVNWIALGQPGAVPNDTAVQFLGMPTGGYVDVPSMTPLAGGEFTVELWAQLPNAVPDWGLLVGCYEPPVSDDDTIEKGYRLRVRTVDGQIEIEANLGGMSSPDTAQVAIDDPPWHHVVLTYLHTLDQEPPDHAELYIDGELRVIMEGTYDVVTTQSLRFGGGYLDSSGEVTYPYLGLLDEVALYLHYWPEVAKHFNTVVP